MTFPWNNQKFSYQPFISKITRDLQMGKNSRLIHFFKMQIYGINMRFNYSLLKNAIAKGDLNR